LGRKQLGTIGTSARCASDRTPVGEKVETGGKMKSKEKFGQGMLVTPAG